MSDKKTIDLNDLYVIIDFDHTITSNRSKSSWGVLDSEEFLPKKIIEECKKYRDYYLPIEKDCNISFNKKSKMMEEWYKNHLELLIKYKLDEDTLNKITRSKNCMELRKDADKFFKFANENNIPIIIISAGITNVIEKFLKENNSLYDNVYIVANIIKFKNGFMKGFRNKIIHSLNKDKIDMPTKVKKLICDKKQIILIGDNISDILMIPREKESDALKIGFLNDYLENYKVYNQKFDIVYDANTSFEEIIKLLKNIDS